MLFRSIRIAIKKEINVRIYAGVVDKRDGSEGNAVDPTKTTIIKACTAVDSRIP